MRRSLPEKPQQTKQCLTALSPLGIISKIKSYVLCVQFCDGKLLIIRCHYFFRSY